MVGISQGYIGIYFPLYLAPLLIAHTAVNPSPNYGDFILFTNNPHVSFMCLELSFLSLSPENLFYLGSFFVQCLEEFWVFHWAGNWTTVKGEDFFPIGQKSVKQWLRYSNWSFKDYNQGFGEKKNSNINDGSELFWSFAIALAGWFVAYWKTYSYLGGKVVVSSLGLEMPFNNLKLCL